MKISLQIILADARSPGRGLPPQPFDRHISEELPNLDNIIQQSESQYGDSARADTIQLPRRPDRPGAGRRLRHSGPGTAPFAPPLGFEVPSLGLGGHLAGVPDADPRPASGCARPPSRSQLSPTPAALPSGRSGPVRCRRSRLTRSLAPGLGTPLGPGPVPALAEKGPASRVPPRLPAGPREDPRFQPRSPRRCPLAGSLTRRSVLPRDTRDFKRRPSAASS